MNLADQVCSLELAKKLFTLGVNQKSLFHWAVKKYSDGRPESYEINYSTYQSTLEDIGNGKEIYAAFTVAELGEILPDWIATYRNENLYFCGWNENIYKLSGKFSTKGCYDEADARAKILIYLIENDLIKVED